MIVTPRRILVVDDQKPVTGILKLGLERTGRYIVLEENDPEQALDAARSFRPHLVLMDMDMPRMCGGELAEHFHRDSELRHLKIAFFSSLITSASDVSGEPRNVYWFSKPMGIAKLLDLLSRIFRSEDASVERPAQGHLEVPA